MILKLKKLKLTNFMGYKDEHEIDFEVPTNSPVMLFLGENGHGKTTIQHATRWCLYGETKDKERIIPKSNLINRKALLESDEDLIEMSVQLTWEDQNKNYDLVRKWKQKKDQQNSREFPDEPQLRIDGGNPVPPTSIPEYVQRFLAKEISHFFFFNGEVQNEFDQMTSNSNGAAFIRSEIEKTLNIPVINDAIEWLMSREAQESSAITKANKNNEKIKQSALLRDQAEKEKLVQEEELNKQAIIFQEVTFKIDILEKEFGNIEEVAELANEIAVQKGKSSALLEQRNITLEQIREIIGSNIWMPISSELEEKWHNLNSEKQKNIENDQKFRNLRNQIELLKSLKSQDTCPLCKMTHTSTPEGIEERIADIESQIKSLNIRDSSLIEMQLRQLLEIGFEKTKVSKIRDLQKDFDENGASLAKSKSKLVELQTKLSLHGNVDVKNAVTSLKALMREQSDAKASIERYSNDIKQTKANIDKYQLEISKGGSVSVEKLFSYNSYRYLRSLFESGREVYSDAVRNQVEKYASETFNSIISDKKFIGLKINQNYGVDLLLKNGEIEPLRSTGQGKISAIALISGLIKTAMPEGFILMDTPFGSLDMGHREEVCKWAATSGLRVSLFMHSGEFDRTIDSKFFGNSIGRVYRIRQTDENESTIEVEI